MQCNITHKALKFYEMEATFPLLMSLLTLTFPWVTLFVNACPHRAGNMAVSIDYQGVQKEFIIAPKEKK